MERTDIQIERNAIEQQKADSLKRIADQLGGIYERLRHLTEMIDAARRDGDE